MSWHTLITYHKNFTRKVGKHFVISRKFHSSPYCANEPYNQGGFTHFGFKEVPAHEKASLVGKVFSNVANKYDLMNDLMSAGIHRSWKDEFMKVLSPTPGTALLDVAGGTGDIAFRFVDTIRSSPLFIPSYKFSTTSHASMKQSSPSRVMVCDINPDMIEVGKQRAAERGYDKLEGLLSGYFIFTRTDPSVGWIVGDAEQLPVPYESVDCYTIAFGIRNCTNIDKVIAEAFRVLKKGGRFLCLEFSHIDTSFSTLNPFAQGLYPTTSHGQIVANDRGKTVPEIDLISDSYQYLVESIRKFPTQEQFCEMIEKQGFSLVTYKNLTFGVTAIHSGFKL